MHICFLTNEYPKEGFPHGGLGSFVKTIAEALVKEGIHVSVIGLNYSSFNENEILNGVRIYRIKRCTIKGLSWYFNFKKIAITLARLHAQTPIDIIEGSEMSFAFLPKLKKVKYLIRLHGGHHFFSEAENREINWWKAFQEKRSFSKADAFIAVSDYVMKHTANYLSYHNKPISIIFNPVNINLFKPYNIPVAVNHITFAGTICEKKGVRQLIQSFPYVKKQFPDAVLNIYGRDWFFQDGSSYIEMLKEKELPKIVPYDKDVNFKGTINYNEIPRIYSSAEVCVFPSHMETLGLVAPEAMACEKPVVFTNLGPGLEIISNGLDGITVNPHNPEEIAQAIIKLLGDKSKAKEIGKMARIKVMKKFDTAIITNKNIDFYNKILYQI